MEKKRVSKGEKYWYIGADKCIPVLSYDMRTLFDDDRYRSGNYFTDNSEAVVMASKLRAVLNGADVIETPSEEEMKKSVDYIASECVAEPTGWIEELQRPELSFKDLKDAIIEGVNLIKSKIVK